MRRVTAVGAVFLAAVFVVTMMASQAFAKPKSVLKGVLGYYSKQGKIVEAKMRKGAWELVLLKGDKILMYKGKGKEPAERVKPLHKYDIKKLKALKIDAKGAHDLFLKYPKVQKHRPTVRAVTIREKENGDLEFLVHVWHPMGGYLYAWPVDPKTKKIDAFIRGLPNPTKEKWSEAFVEGEEQGQSGAEKGKADEKPAGQEKPAAGKTAK